MTVTINGNGPGNWDSSGNLGVGTASPNSVSGFTSVTTNGATGGLFDVNVGGTLSGRFYATAVGTYIGSVVNTPLQFYVNGGGQAAITTAGLFQFNSGYGSVATAYGCRAWVNFNGNGTVAIRASGNVSSITDNGTGDYTVNYSTALVDGNYAVSLCTTEYASTNNVIYPTITGSNTGPTTQTTTALRINTAALGSPAAKYDMGEICVSIFR